MKICPKAHPVDCVIEGLLCDQAIPHNCKEKDCAFNTYCYRLKEELPCIEEENKNEPND